MEPDTVLNNRYKIIRSLGEGGMANVYLGEDTETNTQVAIKILRLDLQNNPEFIRRFQREVRAAVQLVQPNIVRVLDAGSSNGTQYLVMEYVDGQDLKSYIQGHFPIPFQQVVDMMQQILSGIAEAHNHGIVHRDLKPQNILVDQSGKIKITDFGIAVARSEFGMTQTNTVMGSVHYLSPEQSRGAIATNKSDIYSLGIILYELLTNQVPFEGESAVSIALKHSQETIPSAKKIDPNIPQALENVIVRATAKNPDNRYLTAEDMSNDLSTVLSPRRANEEPLQQFVDPIQMADTQVMQPTATVGTAISQEMPSSQNSVATEPVAASVQQQPTKKRRKRWPWVVGFLFIVVAGTLALALSTPVNVKVPDVTNMSQSDATKKIESANLKVGSITQTTSKTVNSGNVISTDPSVGSSQKKGSTINLVISTGAEKIPFGNYVGADFTTVANQLRALGYTVNSTTENSSSVSEGKIIKQSISADTKVDPSQTTVILTVSNGPTASSSTSSSSNTYVVPNFVGTTYSSTSSVLQNVGVLFTKSDSSSDSPSGTILNQSIAPGSTVNLNNHPTIVFTVSTGSTSGN